MKQLDKITQQAITEKQRIICSLCQADCTNEPVFYNDVETSSILICSQCNEQLNDYNLIYQGE